MLLQATNMGVGHTRMDVPIRKFDPIEATIATTTLA
eukprot:COSAG05_NODE_811_length_7176_cov_2.226791_2_plen_36_part_00